ncbi:hypothetical protein BASA61_006824 [Batrachochytrium salamandrivorans]|nr:hypothetical protein BASA61_006824 [Batrachochytrium salamandrivorans]
MKIPTIAVLICLEIVASARVAPRIRGRAIRLHRRSPVAPAHYLLGDPLVALQGMDGVLLDKRDDESSDSTDEDGTTKKGHSKSPEKSKKKSSGEGKGERGDQEETKSYSKSRKKQKRVQRGEDEVEEERKRKKRPSKSEKTKRSSTKMKRKSKVKKTRAHPDRYGGQTRINSLSKIQKETRRYGTYQSGARDFSGTIGWSSQFSMQYLSTNSLHSQIKTVKLDITITQQGSKSSSVYL